MNPELERLAGSLADGASMDEVTQSGSAAERNLGFLGAIAEAFRNSRSSSEDRPEPLFEWRHLKVESQLGEGGFGVVYQAYDSVLRRRVALKLARPERGGARNDLIIAEARRMARLRHPNILAIHGADRDNDMAGIWCDLIEGDTLKQRIERDGPLTSHAVLQMAALLADALQLIHERGLTHGDIKPSNVMIRNNGEPVLMDFGAGSGVPGEAVLGSPIVMAPELFQGDALTSASDVYSFGAMLYYALTGAYPVNADNIDQLSTKHEAGSDIDFSPLPGELRSLIQHCLRADAESRPSADRILGQLNRIAEAPARRRRQLAIGTIIFSLSAALMASSIGLWQTTKARQQADAERSRAESSLSFVVDMLEAPRLESQGTEVRVAEVLDNAARQLERTSLPQAIAAGLHYVLGRTYKSIDQDEKAGIQLNAAFEKADNDGDRIDALLMRAEMEGNREEFEAAAATLQQISELARDNPSIEPTQRLLIELEYGTLAEHQGDQNRALELLLRVNDADPGLPSGHHANAGLWLNLAGIYRDQAKMDLALEYANRALAWYVEHGGGQQGVGAIRARHQTATVLMVLGRYAEAEALSRENLAYLEQLAPGWSDERMPITAMLIDAMGRQGNTEEALTQTLELLALSREHMGPDSIMTIQILINLGALYFERGEYAQATEVTRNALETGQRTMGADSTGVLLVASNLGEFLLYLDSGSEALEHNRATYENNRRVVGDTHLYTLFSGDNYGASLVRWGDVEQGLALLDTILAAKTDQFGADNPFTWDTQRYRVEALLASGQNASELAAAVHEHYLETSGPDHHKTRSAAALLERARSH
ncbi:MAG: serine/threonine-protein kinase [Xanthomonadales bacterium]|nr:serine/threonine-protein kinase [Xanthomonadales bacterium]